MIETAKKVRGVNKKPFNFKVVYQGSNKYNFYIQHPRYEKEPTSFVINNHLRIWWDDNVPDKWLNAITKIKNDNIAQRMFVTFSDESEYVFQIIYCNELPS